MRETELHAADEVWQVLAPLFGRLGRRRVRVSRDGGRSYTRRDERPLTSLRPGGPAAVLVYNDVSGSTRMLVCDLDVGRPGGRTRVEADAANLTALFTGCGLAVVSDVSPSGGRHLYVPLRLDLPFGDAVDLVKALGRRAPSLDVSVMTRIHDSCVRIPGSPHKRGGFQTLIGSVDAAAVLLAHGNPPEALSRLQAELADDLAALRALFRGSGHPAPVDGGVAAGAGAAGSGGPGGVLGARLRSIAVEGVIPTGYGSPSEARQAVLTGVARRGWRLADVALRLEEGSWPGLASLYARYLPGQRRQALVRDWRKAEAFVASTAHAQTTSRRRSEGLQGRVSQSDTSEPLSQGAGLPGSQPVDNLHDRLLGMGGVGEERRFLRDWRTELHAVETTRWSGKGGLGLRMTLRSVLAMAMARGIRYVEVGVRGYAISAGNAHGTVAEHLKLLREEPDPFLVLVEDDRGLRGDLYELRIPTGQPLTADVGFLTEVGGDLGGGVVAGRVRRRWRRGRVYACRPVFRVLGLPAALAYEQLEQYLGDSHGLDCGDIGIETGLSRAAAYNALATLAAYDLAVCRRGRWHLGLTSPTVVGRRLGADEDVAAQIETYREQRRAWHTFLGILGIPQPRPPTGIPRTPPAAAGPNTSEPPGGLELASSRGSPPTSPPAMAGRRVVEDPELDRAIGLVTRILGATARQHRR